MIRKRKLAIVVAGVLLLAGVAFGVSANNLDGLKSDIFGARTSKSGIFWTEGNFTCTARVADQGSKETAQYDSYYAERTGLWERRGILQNDTNILEDTCNTLPRKQKSACRQGVNELKSIERRLDKINHYMILYYSCTGNDIAWSHPQTRLSFSPYRSTEKKTVVPGTENVLGEWTLSTNKGTATINHLGFQVIDLGKCDIFAEYELRDTTGKILSTAKAMDGVMRFDITPNFVANVTGQKIQLVGRGSSVDNRIYDPEVVCSIEMGLTDVARSRIATEGDNSGFGPYGYLYSVQAPIVGACGTAVDSIFSVSSMGPIEHLCASDVILSPVVFHPNIIVSNGNGMWEWVCGVSSSTGTVSYGTTCFAQSTISTQTGTLTLTADANNTDNKDAKNILAGTTTKVFSVDVHSTDESVDVGKVDFTYSAVSGDLSAAGARAELYLGDTLIATAPNTDISATHIIFGGTNAGELTNLIIPQETKELKLTIISEAIGYEKIGAVVTGVDITQVDTSKSTGVDSGRDVADATVVATASSALFSIVPTVVTPSVSATLSPTSAAAKVKLTANSGTNTVAASSSTPTVGIDSLTFSMPGSNGVLATEYVLYEEGKSGVIVVGAASGSNVIFDLTAFANRSFTYDKIYVIVPTLNAITDIASLTLLKDGVQYDSDAGSTNIGTSLVNELNFGSRSID